MKKYLTATFLALVSTWAFATEKMHVEYPDAIVCSGVSNGYDYELIFYLTNVSHTHFVRYDSGNSNEKIHFHGGTGLMSTSNSSPGWTNCVSNAMSIKEIIENGQALNMFSPVPTGSKISG